MPSALTPHRLEFTVYENTVQAVEEKAAEIATAFLDGDMERLKRARFHFNTERQTEWVTDTGADIIYPTAITYVSSVIVDYY